MTIALLAIASVATGQTTQPTEGVLDPTAFQYYVDQFNADDDETARQSFPNDHAWPFLRDNIPLLSCPDAGVERTWYFRWWTFRKHLKQTPDGWVITEFLPPVPWAGKHNTISCPAAHHLYEARWLRDATFVRDDLTFWLRKGGAVRSYSFPVADAAWAVHEARPDAAFTVGLLPDLIANYRGWQRERQDPNGLYWQIDDRDGMEVSISWHGYRATINSYQYGDARAIAEIAAMKGDDATRREFDQTADTLRDLVLQKLWNPRTQFFKNVPRPADKARRPDQAVIDPDARELYGYTPWYFSLPTPGRGYEVAWKQLTDPQGFRGTYGPTSVERRHPGFRLSATGHPCQWNGPSWPFSTTITLKALANVLRDYPQTAVTRQDYFDLLMTYTRSQRLTRDDGKVVPWIDENLDPNTGAWIARRRLHELNADPKTRTREPADRGKDYNHSGYADPVITGLCGLVPRADDVIDVDPLLPPGAWPWFCLDRVPYHGRVLTIVWDEDGTKFGRGAGLRVMVDGVVVAESDRLQRVTGKLPSG